MKRLIQIVWIAAWVFSFAGTAQAVSRYSCNFEDSIARARWTLNPTASQSIADKIANKWYIGEPGNNSRTGQYGLYISDDNGATAHYQNKGCWNYAYDTIALDPLPAGQDYTIYFDYTVMANIASKFDGIYLLWIPMTKPNGADIKVFSSSNGGSVPTGMDDYIIRLQPNANMDYLCGTVTWRQCVAKIPGTECDGTPHRLAFVWTNGSNTAQQPGAMIDNIIITDRTDCAAPTNLKVTPNGTTVMLQWDGSPTDEYEVSAYSYDGDKWLGPKTVQGTQTSFSGLPIGQADFIVRTKCDEDFYSTKTIESKLIYYPDQLCVDYLNLDNAKCYVANSTTHPSTSTYSDFKRVPAMDYGPSNVNSLHVVHFDRTEYEPRTLYQAKTVPDGELASIRLGNWDDDEFGERIEFEIDVDTIKYPVLLLKYLPILEAPNHDDDENPRFMLDMLINGLSIGRCGMADFNANSVRQNGQLTPAAIRQGWHYIPSGQVEGGFTDIFWKEWTTVGVNLRKPEYQGKKLTVRLTTFDCVFNAHFGYAYFTLGCSDGKLKGMKCGEINETFEAPDGFEYRWAYAYDEKYRRRDGSFPEQYVRGRSQTYQAGLHDDSLYVVDCMFVQDSTCFFSLYASTLATNPISKMLKPKIEKNCRNDLYRVTFNGTPSWVQEIDHVKGDTLKSKKYHIESYEWNIDGLPGGWSDDSIAVFNFPRTGGNYHVTLRTTCGTCEDVLHYDLKLKPLGPTQDTVTVTLCDQDRKNGYLWTEKPDTLYHDYGIDSVVLLNNATSCDSIIYLQLLEPYRALEDTMLLPENLPFTHHSGRVYGTDTKTMVDTIPFSNANCDSTWVLNLEIYESLIVNPVTDYTWCDGDNDSLHLLWDITRGRTQTVYTRFDNNPADTIFDSEKPKGQYDEAIYVGALKPNVYKGTLYFVDLKPEFNVAVDYTLTVNYASSIIAQRWNDILAIKNSDFNGGYAFSHVQWYLNGQPIEQATDFNYFAGEDNQLLFGQSYQALLTRADDGVQLFTCPFVPTPVAADISNMPSLVPTNTAMPVKGQGTAFWYDMLGRLHHADDYDNSSVTSPAAAGYYLLVLQSDNAHSIHHVMVR